MRIWDVINCQLRRTTIRWALRRRAPKTIPMSGPKKMMRNYFQICLGTFDEGWRFYVESINSDGLEGSWHSIENKFGYPTSIPNEVLVDCPFLIIHYLKNSERHYFSPIKFIAEGVTGYHRLWLWKENFSQLLFNRRHLVREERISVLRSIFEITVRENTYKTTPDQVANSIYSVRWFGHPRREDIINYCTLVLDSLVEAGDLKFSDGCTAWAQIVWRHLLNLKKITEGI